MDIVLVDTSVLIDVMTEAEERDRLMEVFLWKTAPFRIAPRPKHLTWYDESSYQ